MYSIGEQVQRAETVRMLPCHLIVSFRVQADFFAVVFPLRDYHFAENNGRCTSTHRPQQLKPGKTPAKVSHGG